MQVNEVEFEQYGGGELNNLGQQADHSVWVILY